MLVATFNGHVVVPVEYRPAEGSESKNVTLVRATTCEHHHGHSLFFLTSELVLVNKRENPETQSDVTGWPKCCRILLINDILWNILDTIPEK